MLSRCHIERLILALIRTEQDRLIRQGRQTRHTHVDTRLGALGNAAFSDLTIDEESLGFDSLMRLDLVATFTRFFGLATTGIEDYLLVHRTLPEWTELMARHFKQVGAAAEITFSSSGSTGCASHHMHSLEALQSEVTAHLQGALAKRPTRVLVSVPAHHIYGFLWGGLLPDALGVEAIDLPTGLGGAIQRHARPGDLIISTPFGWAQVAKTTDRALCSDVTGVTSGAPATSATWDAATQLGLARMIEIYGASETGGIGWRTGPDQAFALCGDLIEQESALYRAGVSGPLPLQDHLHWQEPARFHVLGRKDKQVQVGGVTVSLAAVRTALLAQPGVQDAAVRLDADRLKAFIATDAARKERHRLEADLRNGLLHLPAPARPVRYTFGSDLPRSATGKLCDWDTA